MPRMTHTTSTYLLEPETRELELPSGTVTITDAGTGPTLLFVHAGMWSFIWRDVVARLSGSFRCITVDFPGFGLAPAGGDAPPTLSGLSDVLAELVAFLDLDRYTLVAHDLGGPVGLATAARHADRIDGLVLANTLAWEPRRRTLRTMLRLMGSGWMRRLDAAIGLIPAFTTTRLGVGRQLDQRERRAFAAPFADRDRIRRFHDLMRSALDSSELFAAVEAATAGPLASTPVLTIFGQRNDPFRFQRRIAARFADHAGHIVPGGNHFPMCDDPGRFAAAVTAWHSARVAPRR